MELTRYGFSDAVGAFFEMPTADARNILPPHLEPVEVMHTRSILALTAFHFTDSEVGAYEEVVLSVVVPPRVEPGQALPKAAFYPFVLGTSTEASRVHAIERWHLPHFMKDLDIALHEQNGRMTVRVSDDRSPVLELTVTQRSFEPVHHLYHSFMVHEEERFKVNIFMQGPYSEHEEEEGGLVLYEHPLTDPLTREEVSTWPFREQWLKNGIQTFEVLERV